MKNKWIYAIIVILLITALSFISNSLSQRENNSNNSKLHIVASFYPLYFFASEIGGENAEIVNLIPAGTEPHNYDPSPRDIILIEDSDMLILNGGIEVWVDKIKSNLKEKEIKVIKAGEELFTKEMLRDGKRIQDPHVWLNPIYAKKQVEKITRGYITTDPANTGYYENKRKALDGKLDKLNEMYKQGLENCQRRDFITSHAAFVYLAEQYGLRQVAISGLSPDQDPSVSRLAEIADFAKKNNIKYIFFETLVSPKFSETIAQEIDAETLVLDPIEGLSDDDIRTGKNYFTAMENNLKNLQTALQCEN